MLRLYATTSGEGSLTVVGRGLMRAAEFCGLYGGTYSIDEQDPDRMAQGACTPAAVVVGYPGWIPLARVAGMHQRLAFEYAPNSRYQPPWIYNVAKQNRVDRIIVPSLWCAQVSLESWGADIPVEVVRHGVAGHFRPMTKSAPDGPFTILHHAGSEPERKGTFELLQALSMWEGSDVRLVLSCSVEMAMVIESHPAYSESRCCELLTPTGVPIEGWPSNPAPVEQYRRSHLVCQPSRSEGFGLVPLEARACGVPVVITVNTGHVDHAMETPVQLSATGSILSPSLYPGVCDIESGPEAPMECELGGLAPTVSPDAILASLREVYDKFSIYKQAALDAADWVRHSWSWEAQAGPFVEEFCASAEENYP